MPKGGELSEGELRFVNQIIGEEPQWVRWVKKTNRKDVVQDRLLAVGIYRIFSIKRTKTGKKQIQRAGHILGLKEIFSDDIDKVRMDFGDFKIIVTGTSLGMELPKVLLNCFHKITFTYPEYAVPKLVLLPHGRNPPPIDPLEPGIAGGLIETYFAQCDFLNVPPSGEVITYLEDESNTDERQMNLDCIQGFSKNSEFSFNPTPLLASLRHNTYFTSLSCHDKSRKDIVPLIADVLLHNKTLTTIDLTGLEAEEGWTQVGDALRGNPSHQIMDLILSDNPINDKAAAALGSGIATPHGPGIRKYKMTNTKITAAGAGALIKGLSVKREYGNFTEIDLSQNSLKGAGMSFSELVASMQSTQSRLQRILLAHTQVDLAPLVDGIRHTLYGVVEHLDFTGCRMDDHAAKLCTYFFEKTTSIKHVLMGSCGLSGHQIAAMLTAISSNGKISELTVDFSNNILDTKNECDIFCKAISESKNLYSLSLRELEFGKLGDENLSLVVKALSNNFCIREIDLSGNFKIKPKEKDNGLGALQLLATVLEKHTTITSLKFEGIGQNSVGRNISTLFPILGESSKIQKLDIRGHGFGDAGAKELFDILRWNKSILSLKFDNNLITQAGWAFALRCLNANRTIQEIEYPKMDIARVVAKTSTFATHESVFSIFSKISKFTANNASGEFDERGPVPTKPSKEHAYQVRKASRMATMVISRMTSGSIPPLPFSPSSSSSSSLSLSFDEGSDTDSNDSGSNLPSPTGRPPIPPRTNFSSPSLSSPLSPSKNYHSPLPPPLLPPLPPPLSFPLSDFPSSPTLGPPPFPSSSLSLSLSSEPPLGEPPLPPPPF